MFVASAFRTAFGFGEALIAVPLLSLMLPVQVSAPIAVFASIVIAMVAIIRDREHIHVASVKSLLLATALGIPFGLVVLRCAPAGAIKAILAVLLLLFSIFSLYRPGFFTLKTDRSIWLFGFLAGVTGGSYGMNGPPLAIYGAGRGWSPDRFRATIQAYFLPASLLGMIGYYISGVWTKDVSIFLATSLPSIAVGIFFGLSLSKGWDQKRFTRILYGALAVVACVLLAQSLA